MIAFTRRPNKYMYMAEKDDSSSKQKKSTVSRRKKPAKEKPGEGDEHLKKQISEALQANLTDYVKRKNLSQKQVTTLNSFIEEHLSCFILLGYTVDGNTLTVVNASTQKDSDSLGTLMQKFIVRHLDPPGSLPPLA